jgi:hypothetical protein
MSVRIRIPSLHNMSVAIPFNVAGMKTASCTPALSDLPLWRLLVALSDAEEVAGPDSESVSLLCDAVEEKLRRLRRQPPGQEGTAREE